MANIYKNPLEASAAIQKPARKVNLDFATMQDKDLLNHFLRSSGFGFTGSHRNGRFTFHGPDWEDEYNPMSREDVIAELLERKRIDEEEDGDWFDYLDEK